MWQMNPTPHESFSFSGLYRPIEMSTKPRKRSIHARRRRSRTRTLRGGESQEAGITRDLGRVREALVALVV
jgi:hypothetical protein